MTWRSWSVQRSMAWVWRSCRRTVPRRTSRAGSSCACSKIGARRSPVSSSTTPVSGSYQQHSRRSSKPCVCSCIERAGVPSVSSLPSPPDVSRNRGTIYPGIPPAPDAPTDSIRLRVAEAVMRMMEAVADDGPVLLAFDDLQFLDPASREVLFLITQRLERVPTLILAGARAGDAELRPEETGHGGLVWKETIHLQPLDRSQALSLIRDLSVDCEDVSSQIGETIVRLAQGNPYHIEMLLADWRTHRAKSLAAAESSEDTGPISWTPPEDLRSAFARQYGGLSTDAQHVLQILSVAGKAMVPSELATLLGLQDGVVERAALEMLDRGVGRGEEGRLSFKNELHRAYVYYAMGEDRRHYHHAQLAQRLAGAQDRHPPQPMLERGHPVSCAGMRHQAMETALQAAEVAIARGAPREAERVLTRLLGAYAVAPAST